MEVSKQFYSFEAHHSIVSCDFECNPRSALIKVRNGDGQLLTKVGFSAKKGGTRLGLEIIKSALTAWVIGKFRQAFAIVLNFELDERSFYFLNQLNEDVIGTLNDSKRTLILAKNLVELPLESMQSMPNQVYIGRSGGRDASAAAHILSECDYKLHTYKIAYDHTCPPHNADYATYESDRSKIDNYPFFEPFDIPVTYFSPLWSVHNTVPEYIAIGHSFDVLGFDSHQRRAPYESPGAMKIHQNYLNSLLNSSVKFTFPLASLSTYSVFEYIRRKFGLSVLKQYVSCWNSSGSDCGYCDKCQRIKLASTGLHLTNHEYMPDMPQVIDHHGFLFGNPAYDSLVKKCGIDSLGESQLFSSTLSTHEKIVDYLYRRFSKSYKQIEAETQRIQSMFFQVDPNRIGKEIEIDYRTLPSECINKLTVSMPYEHYFSRSTPVLAAHGEIPTYSSDLGWRYSRICDGPRLEVPDSTLFRRFFNQTPDA